MKKILITGSNGQLGKEITKKYSERNDIELMLTDVSELDITDVDKTIEYVQNIKPYAIINCAAHTGVDACETDIENAYKINSIGARNLAIASEKTKSKIVQISTDYVFDGNATLPIIEFEKTNPQGIYGKSKLQGEEFVREMTNKFFIIRTAWLYGEGNNFVKTMLRLSENNKKVRVVNDQYGTPTSTKELANIVDRLIFTDNYGIFHGTCEGKASWCEFAREIFKLAKLEIEVEGIATSEYPTPAKRPAYSVLENYMLKITNGYVAKNWQDSLEEYIKEII